MKFLFAWMFVRKDGSALFRSLIGVLRVFKEG